jgi:hypothetical protein
LIFPISRPTNERYREQLASDPDIVESLRRVEAAGCILNEDRSFPHRIPEQESKHPARTAG